MKKRGVKDIFEHRCWSMTGVAKAEELLEFIGT